MNLTDEDRPGGNGVAQGAEARLTQALEEYRRLLEAGAGPDRAEFLARHPDLGEALAECLSGLEFVHAVAPAVSGAAAETATAADASAGVGPGAPLGDFRIIREVGRGGMGVVYKAEQLSLGRRVALKVLPFAATMDPRQLQRFHNEARAAAGLHHTNIVPVYGVGSERGVHYYAMQFIEGRTLADLIAEQRREAVRQVPTTDEAAAAAASTVRPAAQATSAAPRDAAYFRRAAAWGIQAAEALDCAHSLGVVHRDVKPANLLVDAAGRLWVTDFGLAQVQSDARLTMTGDLVGTLRYMSPEQALAKRVVVDHRTDLYSLGATLYELLTLEPAFSGADRQELLRQIAFEEPKAPRRLNRAIPAELETIVLKALEKNPAERYGTAQELADDLRRFQEDRPIRARRASVVQRLRKLARRHRAVVGAAAVCLLVSLVAMGASGGWVLSDRAARQREAEIRQRDAEARVEEALEAAKPGLRDGNPGDLALISAAKRVEAQLDSGAVGPDVRQRAEQLLRDLRMLADLEEIRLRQAETPPEGNSGPNAKRNEFGRFNNAATEPRYAAAFSQYGIEVLALDPADAAARMRDSAIHEALLAGLDGWIQVKPEEDPDRARLRLSADAADDSAWRRAFREAALAADMPKLKLLAAQPEAPAQPPGVLAWQGQVLRNFDLLNESQAIMRQAQQRHPGDFWINYNLGAALTLCPPPQHPEEAIGYFRAAIAIRPNSAEANSYLGQALCGKGDPDAAIAAYQQALEIDPNFGIAASGLQRARKMVSHNHVNLGLALLGQRRYREAEEESRVALRYYPDNVNAHLCLGWALRDQARYKEAEAEFREALRVLPHNPGLHNDLGCFLRDQGRYKEAEAEFREALRVRPDDPETHSNLGSALSGQERYKEAEAEYREAIRLKPDFEVAYGNLGDMFATLGQWEKASADFVKAAECKECKGYAWYCRALLCLGEADDDGYRRICAAMLERYGNADDPGPIDYVTWTCSLAPNSGAEPARLVSLMEKAVAKSPKEHTYVNDLGVALYRAGRFEEAAKRLTEATTLNPDPSKHKMLDTWFFLAMAHHRLGHADEARRWLDKAVQATEEALKPPAEPPEKSVTAPGTTPPTWHRKLTLQLLGREAKELIQPPGTKLGR
jgi:serine/threonine protein kinase/Tfp pilus assembly protein PilF